MSLCRVLCWIFLLLLLPILGCGGGNDPVNEGKDRPMPPKKDKDK
jgi:hypothetical protein